MQWDREFPECLSGQAVEAAYPVPMVARYQREFAYLGGWTPWSRVRKSIVIELDLVGQLPRQSLVAEP